MLRPAVRTSVIAACSFGIEHLDHAAPFGAALVPAEAEIADQLVQPLQPAQVLVLIVLGELDQQDRRRLAAHECLQRRAEHRDLARQLDHGAVDQLDRDRRELDDVLGRLHRLVEAAEMAGADRAAAEQRRQLQFDRGGEAERAFGADQDVREVDVVACPAPARRDCSRRPGAAPWGSAPRSRRPRARRARADRAASGRSGEFAGRSERSAADRAEMRLACRRPAARRSRARSRACCRSAASAPPQELLPVMPPMVAREAVEISTGNHRPCGLSWRLRSSSTMPGSTAQRRPATSRSRMRLRYFEQSTTSEWLTVCPACEVPPPRASTLTPSARAIAIARSASSIVRGVDHAERHDLVMRGVGGIAAAREAVELHVARQLRPSAAVPARASRPPRHQSFSRLRFCLCMDGLVCCAENRLTAMLHS